MLFPRRVTGMIIEFLIGWVVTALVFNVITSISLKERNEVFNHCHVGIIVIGSLITTGMAQWVLWMLNW